MIIEFSGLPATGKTTVSRLLGTMLTEQGYTVCYGYPIKESRIKRYFSYIFDGSLKLWFLGMRFALCSIRPRRAERYKYISNLIAYYRMYQHFQKNRSEEILIIDQGILQGIASVVHMDQIIDIKELNYIFIFLERKNIKIYSVECENDPNLSQKRIRARKSTGARWEQYDDETMKQGFLQQVETFKAIRECSHAGIAAKYISVDTKLAPENNAEKIMDFINLQN